MQTYLFVYDNLIQKEINLTELCEFVYDKFVIKLLLEFYTNLTAKYLGGDFKNRVQGLQFFIHSTDQVEY